MDVIFGSFEWDHEKCLLNKEKHDVYFTEVRNFWWDVAKITLDERSDYGELREIAVSFINSRLHVMVYTRRGDLMRIISLRKANKREHKAYEQEEA